MDRRRAWRRAQDPRNHRRRAGKNPFEAKYNQISSLIWESCSEVLNRVAAKEALERRW